MTYTIQIDYHYNCATNNCVQAAPEMLLSKWHASLNTSSLPLHVIFRYQKCGEVYEYLPPQPSPPNVRQCLFNIFFFLSGCFASSMKIFIS